MKPQYRVFGYRYRHIGWVGGWSMVQKLPEWLEKYRKREPKKAKKWWVVERLYYRLPKAK